MRRPRIVAFSLSVGLTAACAVPSEPPSMPAAHVTPLEGSPVSAVQNSQGDPRSSQRIRYEIPPGVHQLYFNTGVSALVSGVRFSFTGQNHPLRIRRVRDNCNLVDITFADHTPHEATRYFAQNPINVANNVFYITVENSAQDAMRLQVTARFDAGSSPPCGL